MLPNGIIAVMDGPYFGSRNDRGMLAIWLDSVLRLQMIHNGTQYLIYGDPGYTAKEYLQWFFGGEYVSAEEMEFNRVMSSLRVVVEWGFGKIISLFAYLDFKKALKIRLH